MNLRQQPRGATLIEIVVAASIAVMVIGMSLEISLSSTRAISEQLIRADLEVKAERTLKFAREALTESANIFTPTHGRYIDYYLPRDNDGTGTVLEAAIVNGIPTGSPLQYGIITELGSASSAVGKMRFEFIVDRQLSETQLNVDINGDGDLNDVYEIGYLQRITDLPGDLPQVIGVSNIIQRVGGNGASILYDNEPADTTGRIFIKEDNNVLTINLWLLSVSSERQAHLLYDTTKIFLRND